jgi:hypothetical protein
MTEVTSVGLEEVGTGVSAQAQEKSMSIPSKVIQSFQQLLLGVLTAFPLPDLGSGPHTTHDVPDLCPGTNKGTVLSTVPLQALDRFGLEQESVDSYGQELEILSIVGVS